MDQLALVLITIVATAPLVSYATLEWHRHLIRKRSIEAEKMRRSRRVGAQRIREGRATERLPYHIRTMTTQVIA